MSRNNGSSHRSLVTYFSNPHRQWGIAAFALLFVIVLLWMPFGLKITDTQEGWYFLFGASQSGWVFLGTGRLMVMLPWEAAAFLTPDSFVGAQLVLTALFWGKAFCLYLLLRQLRMVNNVTAFLVAVLFVIYPADDGLFTLRALGRHSAVFFYLLAALFLVLACKRGKDIYVVFMIVAHAIACFTAEAGALLALATPAVILLYPQCSKRRKILIAAIWYIILALSLYFVVHVGATYQTKRFDQGFTESSFLMDVILSNLNAYWLGFINSWWKVMAHIDLKPSHLAYATAITFVVIGAIWWNEHLMDAEGQEVPNTSKHFWILLLAGLIIFGLGFFPYSVTDLRYDTWRVFYYAAIGSALFWGAIIRNVSQRVGRWENVSFNLLSASFVFLAALNGLDQHASVAAASRAQQQALVTLIEQAPYLEPETIVVLLVTSPKIRPFPNDQVFRNALNWVYKKRNVYGLTCYTSISNCEFDESGVQYRPTNPAPTVVHKKYLYQDLILFQYFEDRGVALLQEIPSDLLLQGGTAANYDPYERIAAYIPFPERPQKAFVSSLGPDPARTAPQAWKGAGLNMNDRRVCDVAQRGQCALHLQGDGTTPATFSQQVAVNGKAGATVKLSLWDKLEYNSVSAQLPQAKLTIFYTDGTTSEHILHMDDLSDTWSFSELSVEAAKAYTRILVSLESGMGSGSVLYDYLELTVASEVIPVKNSSFEK